MRPLTALLISDGRPGHYHLSEGILAAAARLRPLEIRRVEVERPGCASGWLLANLVNIGISPLTVWRGIYGLDPDLLAPADLVVSAGAETLAPNVAASRLLRAPNVFYGSLRQYRPEHFSLVLTSFPSRAALPHHEMALKPSPLDPDTLPLPTNGNVLGALLGGPTREVRFAPDDWTKLFAFLSGYHRHSGGSWIVSNSRRTPPEVSDALLRLAEDPANGIARVIDVRTSGPGTLKQLYEQVSTVLCTIDSSSMVSEAVWLRRKVIAAQPARGLPNVTERGYRDFLHEQGWSRTLKIATLAPASFEEALAAITPIERNPLEVLADLLKQRLPALFAGE